MVNDPAPSVNVVTLFLIQHKTLILSPVEGSSLFDKLNIRGMLEVLRQAQHERICIESSLT